MKEVFLEKPVISKKEILFTRTSQCLALGVVDVSLENTLAGLIHIHPSRNCVRELSNFFKSLKSEGLSENFGLYLSGGVRSFIPYFGWMDGEPLAEKSRQFIETCQLSDKIVSSDTIQSYVRLLTVDPVLKFGAIERVYRF